MFATFAWIDIDAGAPVIPPVHLIGYGVDVPEAHLGTPKSELESRLATRERLRCAMALINIHAEADHAYAAPRDVAFDDATALLDPRPLIVLIAQSVLHVEHACGIRQMTVQRGPVALLSKSVKTVEPTTARTGVPVRSDNNRFAKTTVPSR